MKRTGKSWILIGIVIVAAALFIPYLQENVFYEDVSVQISVEEARLIAEQKIEGVYGGRAEIGPYTLEVGTPVLEKGVWVVEVKIYAEELGAGDCYHAWVKIRTNEVIVETCA